jgi:hypothetical protein
MVMAHRYWKAVVEMMEQREGESPPPAAAPAASLIQVSLVPTTGTMDDELSQFSESNLNAGLQTDLEIQRSILIKKKERAVFEWEIYQYTSKSGGGITGRTPNVFESNCPQSHQKLEKTIERLRDLDQEISVLEHSSCEQVESYYKEVMGNLDTKLVKKLMFCVRQQDSKGRLKIGAVSKDDSVDEVEETILYTILKGQNMSLKDQLHLTITWNQPALAEKFVLSSVQEADDTEDGEMHQFLLEALQFAMVMDRVDFVALLLDCGADICSVDLNWVYNECIGSSSNGRQSLSYLSNLLHTEQYLDLSGGSHSGVFSPGRRSKCAKHSE